MKFEEALSEMRKGKKTKHRDKIYFIKDNQLRCIRLDDKTKFLYLGHLNCDEVLEEDWEIVEDD